MVQWTAKQKSMAGHLRVAATVLCLYQAALQTALVLIRGPDTALQSKVGSGAVNAVLGCWKEHNLECKPLLCTTERQANVAERAMSPRRSSAYTRRGSQVQPSPNQPTRLLLFSNPGLHMQNRHAAAQCSMADRHKVRDVSGVTSH